DTHVFCLPSQIEDGTNELFDFMQRIYGIFSPEFHLGLSTSRGGTSVAIPNQSRLNLSFQQAGLKGLTSNVDFL
ncbi:hypothetical protein BD769DRAFT_1363997, partial [Suillus cothurnatus]